MSCRASWPMLLEHGSLLADDDALVRRALAVDRGVNLHQVAAALAMASISTPMPWGTSSRRCSSAFSRISSAQISRLGLIGHRVGAGSTAGPSGR